MSAGYRAVQWNRQKLVYDAIMLGGVALYIVAFVLIVSTGSGAADVTVRIPIKQRNPGRSISA